MKCSNITTNFQIGPSVSGMFIDSNTSGVNELYNKMEEWVGQEFKPEAFADFTSSADGKLAAFTKT